MSIFGLIGLDYNNTYMNMGFENSSKRSNIKAKNKRQVKMRQQKKVDECMHIISPNKTYQLVLQLLMNLWTHLPTHMQSWVLVKQFGNIDGLRVTYLPTIYFQYCIYTKLQSLIKPNHVKCWLICVRRILNHDILFLKGFFDFEFKFIFNCLTPCFRKIWFL